MSSNRSKNFKKKDYRSGNYQKGMNKSNSSKRTRREAEDIDGEIKTFQSRTNDVSWYSHFPQLVQDAASISFGLPLGNELKFGNRKINGNWTVKDNFALPGVCAIHFVPGIGISRDKNSPINRAALRVYTYMRSHLKTSSDYDSQDMMMMMMALDSCYMFHAMMQRIYGVAQLYTPVNTYYPRVLLQALNCNEELLFGDSLMELRGYINQFAISLGQYTIPYDVDLFKRHSWMCSGLYVDSDTSRAQTYVFVPDGLYVYDNTVTTGSQLTYNNIDDVIRSAGGWTVKKLKEFGTKLLDGILGDEDAGNISGDLLNAFGENAVKKLTETPEGYRVLPTYDRTVLSQIENASFMGVAVAGSTSVNCNITQDPSVNNGAIKWDPAFWPNKLQTAIAGETRINYYVGANKRILNMHLDSPDAVSIIEATRLMAMCEYNPSPNEAPSNANSAVTRLTTCAADVCTYWRLFTRNTDGSIEALEGTNCVSVAPGDNYLTLRNAWKRASAMSKFDWHPQMWMYEISDTETATAMSPNFDADNVALVDQSELSDINEVSLISLFDIPQMGFVNR